MEAKMKIFGEHDPATIKQIENCIDTGGERGVLCADGHKGYAQPIGGVVAYKDKFRFPESASISPAAISPFSPTRRAVISRRKSNRSWTMSCTTFPLALDEKRKRESIMNCSMTKLGRSRRSQDSRR